MNILGRADRDTNECIRLTRDVLSLEEINAKQEEDLKNARKVIEEMGKN